MKKDGELGARVRYETFSVYEICDVAVADGRFRDKTHEVVRCEAKRSYDMLHANCSRKGVL